MIKKLYKITSLILLLWATACTPAAIVTSTPPPPPMTQAPTITSTPDPCAFENREAEVQKVHKYMREFDDASSLAASRPREELSDAIADLQRIRREAEDQPTPSCLADLKAYQVGHMNLVISTLISFMGGSDQKTVDAGIAQAREQHDKYTLELAKLLGLTIMPATVMPAISETPSPN
jgi:hypothetical protein